MALNIGAMKGGFVSPGRDAMRILHAGWTPLVLCWPDAAGRCACGGDHAEGGKAALFKDYQNRHPTPEDVTRWWQDRPDANVGVLLETSGLVVLDFDSVEGKREGEALGLPPTLVARTARGEHWYYSRPEGCPTRRCLHRGESRKMDVLSKGYVVAPPSRHREGARYAWEGGLDAFLDRAHALPPPPEWVLDILAVPPPPPIPVVDWRLPKSVMLEGRSSAVYAPDNNADERIVQRALDCISAEDYDVWFRVGVALSRWDGDGDGGGRGFAMWDQWSRSSAKYPGTAALETKWRSFGSRGGLGLSAVYAIARESGFDRKQEGERIREEDRRIRRRATDPKKDSRLQTNAAPPQGSWFSQGRTPHA
jgi:hypothetical protein